ncbi:3D domain-containing protein [Clostridium thermarum]|uniref:3D domain-containing protein n=1 Tax=Clostridium thermarum TaxID=1716543 RepID=UPI0013D8DC07|nr:3D domain-containing protein [Clostridium thermarum]
MEKLSKNLKRFFAIGSKSTFMLVLLIIACVTVLYNMRKNVTVIIDGEETNIITYTSSVEKTLERNNITVGPKDKIQPGLDSEVKDGDKIIIKRAVNVNVAVDGKTLQIATAESSIEDMLLAEGITVSDYDRVSPLKTQSITDGMNITITRVTSEIVKDVQTIDYVTEIRKDNNLASNVTKVVQEGEPGEREITTRVVYEDGKEVARTVINDAITKQPVQKVLLQGTLGVLNVSRGGEQVLYRKAIRVKATAYCPCYECTGKHRTSNGYAITATGTIAKRDPNGYSTIAVDPNVIPLGTKVYVEGYGFAIAEDVGGAIKGSKIDVYFDTHSEAMKWGVKYKNVYILK